MEISKILLGLTMQLITEHLQNQFVEQQIGLLQLLAMRVFMDTKLHGEDQA